MVPGESYPIKYKGILTLNQVSVVLFFFFFLILLILFLNKKKKASLEADPVEGKTWLKVKAKGHTFMLCSLVKDEVKK